MPSETFKQKYLKYKQKYLNTVEQQGGSVNNSVMDHYTSTLNMTGGMNQSLDHYSNMIDTAKMNGGSKDYYIM